MSNHLVRLQRQIFHYARIQLTICTTSSRPFQTLEQSGVLRGEKTMNQSTGTGRILGFESQKWFRKALIGSNPMKMSSTRPEEISFWLYENEFNKKHIDDAWFSSDQHWKHFMNEPAYDILSYVVIDDYDSLGMRRFDENLVTTSPQQGLTLALANKAIEILKTKSYKGVQDDQQD